MPQHIPFPDIQQFRNTIRTVRERAEHDGVPLPTLTFVGSVKLHGTNASIVFPATDPFYVQSRSQIITPENDNAGFAKYVQEHQRRFELLAKDLENSAPGADGFVVYGEWCGQGIQKGVAISQTPEELHRVRSRIAARRNQRMVARSGEVSCFSVFFNHLRLSNLEIGNRFQQAGGIPEQTDRVDPSSRGRVSGW